MIWQRNTNRTSIVSISSRVLIHGSPILPTRLVVGVDDTVAAVVAASTAVDGTIGGAAMSLGGGVSLTDDDVVASAALLKNSLPFVVAVSADDDDGVIVELVDVVDDDGVAATVAGGGVVADGVDESFEVDQKCRLDKAPKGVDVGTDGAEDEDNDTDDVHLDNAAIEWLRCRDRKQFCKTVRPIILCGFVS
jgi:hypothetical protein